MSTLKNKRGFTLIELVIVLAIAALILAAVLLAVGGAQKSRRDAQRKSDQGRVVAAIETYASNHQATYPPSGALPASVTTGVTDPSSGNAYAYTVFATPNAGSYHYALGTACDGTAGARLFNLTFGLESGDHPCVDNK